MLTDKALEELRQERHDDYVAEARQDRITGVTRQHAETLSHYTQAQQDAALRIYNTARQHTDTGGGSTCAKLLLGLYNGDRFPFDLTDLRRLDDANLAAAITILYMDASHTWCEIHVLLNAIIGVAFGKSTGDTMELWAHTLRLKGRCKKEFIADLKARAA